MRQSSPRRGRRYNAVTPAGFARRLDLGSSSTPLDSRAADKAAAMACQRKEWLDNMNACQTGRRIIAALIASAVFLWSTAGGVAQDATDAKQPKPGQKTAQPAKKQATGARPGVFAGPPKPGTFNPRSLGTTRRPQRPGSTPGTALPITARKPRVAALPRPTIVLKPGEVPAIQFDTPTYNFGRIRAGTDIRHDFWFTNTGTGPLEILAVKPG